PDVPARPSGPRDPASFGLHPTQPAGGGGFDSLPGLVYCPLTHGQILVLGALLAHGDEGGGFGETVHVGDGPPEVVLEAFDGFGGRRSSRGDHVHTGGDLATVGPRGVGEHDENGRGRAQPSDLLLSE